MHNRIVIEVGANNGSDTAGFANDETFVYAFEPNPILYRTLIDNFKDNKNVLILPFAVDLCNDVAEFNVSDAGDRGIGSLYEYHPDLLTSALGQYAVFHEKFVHKQKVLTIRLDTFMTIWGIDHVDYLHIDAQGNDFRVLQSLGSMLSTVREGRCECTYKVPIYEKSETINFHEDCQAWLEMNGFDITSTIIHANDSEIDLIFKRRA